MKQCSRCNQYKPYTEYHKKTKSPDGKQALCKVCVKDANKTFRTIKPKYAVEWFKTNKKHWHDYQWHYMKADKTPTIYAIVNPANEIYIGMTETFLRIRKHRHYSDFRAKLNTIPKLHKSFEKWGLENHKFMTIAEYPGIDRKELKRKETEWIEKFRKEAQVLNIKK